MSDLSPQEAQARLKLMELDRRTELLEKARQRSGSVWRRFIYVLLPAAAAFLLEYVEPADGRSLFTVAVLLALSAMGYAREKTSTLHDRVDAVLELLPTEARPDRPAADPSDASPDSGSDQPEH